jgi:hypothetical protein
VKSRQKAQGKRQKGPQPVEKVEVKTGTRRHHHSVYVVLLSKDVLYEPKFRRCNPDYDSAKPCVYVGMTGQSPDVRFDKHKAGLKANRYVKQYGQRLLPELYECYNPMPYEAAIDMEIELAIHLRAKGYGVWQG